MEPMRNKKSNDAIWIHKLDKKKYKLRNRVCQFINPNSVMRFLVTLVKHRLCNWSYFYFNFISYSYLIVTKKTIIYFKILSKKSLFIFTKFE